MHKPRIGITCNTLLVEGAVQPGITRTFVNSAYIESIALAGGIPFLLPPVQDLELIRGQVSTVDGLLLSGGPDVDPLLYGEEPLLKLETVNKARDAYEVALIKEAGQARKPLLGICRGIQMINVAYGGTLYQDLSYSKDCRIRHAQATTQSTDLWHHVEIGESTILAQIIGQKEMLVNSYHHQAVNKAAPGFIVAAQAKDQVVEAIERPGDHFVLGVQWHPELLTRQNPLMLSLFQAFIAQAKK